VTRVCIVGVSGRMGSTLARLAHQDKSLTLAGMTSRTSLAPEGVPGAVFPLLDLALESVKPEVVVDFTTVEATLKHLSACVQAKVPMVIGTTGFSNEEKARLAEAAKVIPLVVAPNTSVGVNVVIQMAARLAKALGDGFDVEIVEVHHRKKKDAPSGTALKLAEELAHALGRSNDVLRTERHGVVGERPASEIGVQTVRGGDVVGEHTVYFLGDGERVELTHRATDRDQFAKGALRAARWVVTQKPGLYGMSHVLGLATP
jgi:4-hydroxy-tetrahydrodipicolinate reductase